MNCASQQLAMERDTANVETGDVVSEPKRVHQPKAALCRILSMLWFFPSAGAALIFAVTEAKWLHADGWIEGIKVVRLEQWIAMVVLTTHAAFVWLAWRFRTTEPWKEAKPELDHDLQDPP